MTNIKLFRDGDSLIGEWQGFYHGVTLTNHNEYGQLVISIEDRNQVIEQLNKYILGAKTQNFNETRLVQHSSMRRWKPID